MVRIAKLKLKNFKSFGEATIPFAKGFTVIVGSNGSGKSNILDAIMFGLGITSMKSLRAGKLVDLVNNRAAENYAKVELTLKGDKEKYEISRIVDKQGRGLCKLNGDKKPLNEITSLLLELGIKATGHNIVVQGDITRILEMSPQQRREIIDELAGLSEFDEKKNEALKELDKVDEKLKEVGIVLTERENYLADLDKERETALQYESLVEEKKRSEKTILSEEIGKIKTAQGENEGKLKDVRENRTLKEDEIRTLKDMEKKNRTRVSELNSQILSSSERAYTEIGKEIEGKKSDVSLGEERINSRNQMLQRNSAKIAALQEKNQMLAEEKTSVKGEIADVSSELKTVEQKLKDAVERKKNFDEKHSGEAELGAKESEFEKIEKELHELRKTFHERGALIPEIKSANDERRKIIAHISRELESISRKIDEGENTKQLLGVLKQKYPDFKREMGNIIGHYEESVGEVKGAEAELGTVRNALKELEGRIANCPVCETELDVKRKKELIEKKQEMLKKLGHMLETSGKKSDEIAKRRREIESAAEKAAGYENLLEGFDELLTARKERNERLAELKAAIEKSNVEKIEAELEQAGARMQTAEKKRNAAHGELESLKQEILGRSAGIENEITALTNEKNLLEEKKENVLSKGIERIDGEVKSNSEEAEMLKEENSEFGNEIKEEKKKNAETGQKLDTLEAELKKAHRANKQLIDERNRLEEKTSDIEEKTIKAQQKLKTLEQRGNEINIDNSRHEVKLGDLEEEFAAYAEVKKLDKFDLLSLKNRVVEIGKIVTQLGAINMRAVETFDELNEEVADLRKKSGKLAEEKDVVLEMIGKIEVKRTTVFMECFTAINSNFEGMFYKFFDGKGVLSLSDAENPLESGLVIEAKHKEALQNIDSMSGGEKTLTALAFLFAVQLYDPAPFYIFDEADAALDSENSAKLTKFIMEIGKESQFIAITHNDVMIKQADQIVGVALNEQKSSVIGLKLQEHLGETQGNAD